MSARFRRLSGVVLVLALVVAARTVSPAARPPGQPPAAPEPSPETAEAVGPELYSYDSEGRRDPFVSLLARGGTSPRPASARTVWSG